MSEHAFSDLVKQHFGFLLSDYGFQVAMETYAPMMMGNASVEFQTAHTGVMIVLDRSQVLITLGPVSVPRREWFEFSDVVKHFAPEVEEVYVFVEPGSAGQPTSPETQISRLANLMRRHCEPVLQGDFSAQAAVKGIEEQRVAAMLAQWQAQGKSVVMPPDSQGLGRLAYLIRRTMNGERPRISAQNALAMAQVEFRQLNWPWLEPVHVRSWWGYWEIRTNIHARGRNGFIRISQETGAVAEISFWPR